MAYVRDLIYLSNGTNVSEVTMDIHRHQGLISDDDFFFMSIVCLSCGLAIACCGTFSNIVNIRTFVAMGIGDGVTTLFLAISCSDLAFVVLTSLRNSMVIMHLLKMKKDQWWFSIDPMAIAYFCVNCAYVMYTITVSASTFLAVARCMCVARPLQFKHTFTRSRCLVVLILIILVPLVCQAAVIFHMGMAVRFDEGRNSSRLVVWFSRDRDRVKNPVRLMLGSILPFATQVTVVICVAVMIFKLREAAIFRASQNKAATSTTSTSRETGSSKLTGKDWQVVKQVVLLSLIYVVLNIQKISIAIILTVDPRINIGKRYSNMYHFIHHLSTVFESLNSTVNIFLYYLYNSKFRSLCFSCK